MRRVLMQKIIMKEDQSFLPNGEAHEGWEDVKPAVGESYYIFCDSGDILRTSAVVKISDGTFKTLNSTYKLTVLEEEPFNLTGEMDLKETQKFSLKK